MRESEQRYRKIRKIAEGGYGKVYLAQPIAPGDHVREEVVIKKMHLADYGDFVKEIHFLRDLRETCPEYFPEIYEIFPEIATEHVFMVMKPYDGDLDSLARCDTGNELLLPLTQQILEAYAVIERHLLCHFDLKLDNILVEESPGTGMPQIKIIDWGFAQFYYPGVRSTTICTDVYRAPELFLAEDLLYGREVDLWSIGCLMVGYLTKQFLFDGDNSRQIARRIPIVLRTFPFELCDQVDPVFGWLVRGFLSTQGATRKATYEAVRRRLYRRQWLFDEVRTEMGSEVVDQVAVGHAVVGHETECDHRAVDYRRVVLHPIVTIETIESDFQRLQLPIQLMEWIQLWSVIGRFCLHHEAWSEAGNVFSWLYQRACERLLLSPRRTTVTVDEVRRFVVCLLCIAQQIYCYEPSDLRSYQRLLKKMGTATDYGALFQTVLEMSRVTCH